jgi:Activator of Hsp90 ATPase homolog 1-like protein
VPRGASTVEVDLLPDPEGTLVRLTHRNLPPAAFTSHRAGWEHYLDRLAVCAAGGDAGPDPWRTG